MYIYSLFQLYHISLQNTFTLKFVRTYFYIIILIHIFNLSCTLYKFCTQIVPNANLKIPTKPIITSSVRIYLFIRTRLVKQFFSIFGGCFTPFSSLKSWNFQGIYFVTIIIRTRVEPRGYHRTRAIIPICAQASLINSSFHINSINLNTFFKSYLNPCLFGI